MDTEWPNRHSIRLREYDYSGHGTYFVTICTADRRYLFGQVQDKTMQLSELGRIANAEWLDSVARRPFIVEHAFVVMPNHVHGLVSFISETMPNADRDAIARGLPPRSLGAFLNRYKGSVSNRVRLVLGAPTYHVWQRNYHDRIVRNQTEFDTILQYINENPDRWGEDRFNTDPM
jgi:putative transposase